MGRFGGWLASAVVVVAWTPGAFAQSPDLANVLDRAERYVVEYEQRFALLVAEEHSLVKTGNGRDLALTGRLWIDPVTGEILKTRMIASEPRLRAEITVTFRQDGELSLRVPDRMEEYYRVRAPGELDVRGVAAYSNYRQFKVDTGVDLRKPPGS